MECGKTDAEIGISVIITDKRTRSVVRASSANSTRSLRGL